jgi:hypothetical protein
MAIFGQYLLDRKADIERDVTREIPRQPDILPAFCRRLHRLPGMVGFQRFSRIELTKNF